MGENEMMVNEGAVLVVGATGATGRLLVDELLGRGFRVKAVVRSPERLSEEVKANSNFSFVPGNILEMSQTDMSRIVQDCESAAFCLGHTLSLRGVFGNPRRLVEQTLRRTVLAAVKADGPKPFRVLIMNSAGCRNPHENEPTSIRERWTLFLLRVLIPPHSDNEWAAAFLWREIGKDNRALEWVVVRPDSLLNEERATDFEVHPSPIRSALLNPGVVSRNNVAHFMADLVADEDAWRVWKGRMPVIYNRVQPEKKVR